MRVSEPTILLDDLYFPECMRWHGDQLWFSDMFAGSVHAVDTRSGRATTAFEIDDLAGGLGWLATGETLVCSMEKRRVLAVAGAATRVHVDLSGYFEHPINDMYVDPDGRALVGGFGFDADHGAPHARVPLAVVGPDGGSRLDGNQLLFPNGIDLLAKGVVAVAETFADQITTIAIGPTGELGRATRFAALADGDGPDGICSDRRGGLWVACAFGERVVHLAADGRVDAEVGIPSLGVFDCLLGGPDRRTLFIAVSSHDEEYGRLHRTGSILQARIEV